METNQTRSLLAGLPPRELLASYGLPPDVLDLMMDDDQMAPRALVLTRGAVILGLQLTSGAEFDHMGVYAEASDIGKTPRLG